MNLRRGAGAVGLITLTALRRLARDRTALLFMAVLPVGIILVIGIAIGGISDRAPVGLARLDRSPLARAVAHELEASRALAVHHFSSEAALRRAVRHGNVIAGMVIPDAFGARAERGGVEIAFVGDPTRPAVLAARAVVTAIVDREAAIALAGRVATGPGTPPAAALARARELARTPTGLGVRTVDAGSARTTVPVGFRWTAPTNLVLFMFISSMASSGRLIQLRNLGIARRMLASPTSATALLVGELLAGYALALGQAVIIVLIGTLVFGVSFGDPAAAAAVILMSALVATSIGTLLGTLLRTEEQAQTFGPPIGIAMGMLGGCMWPLDIVGETMRRAGHLMPQAWAIDAFIRLIGAGGHLGDVVPQLAVLAGFTAVVLPVAAARLRRVVLA
jgi:ABC-2 type transport system permease protein